MKSMFSTPLICLPSTCDTFLTDTRVGAVVKRVHRHRRGGDVGQVLDRSRDRDQATDPISRLRRWSAPAG